MEGKKKSGKALLEEKQMKRYFRSIKRSKGKIKKESPKKNSDIEVSKEKPEIDRGSSDIIKDQVTTTNHQKPTALVAEEQPSNSNQTVKTNETEKIKQNKTQEELAETAAVQKNKQAQQAAVVNNPSNDMCDNLDDWEIVQYPDENQRKNENENLSGPIDDKGDIDDVLTPTTDQNNAWVQEMNKINDCIHATFSETPLTTSEGIQSQNEQIGNNQMQEFSPIVYWKDPLPDIAPLEGKSVEEDDMIHIENVGPDTEQKIAKIQKISIEDIIPIINEKAEDEGPDIAKLEVKNATEEDVIYIENIIPDTEQKNAKIQNVFLEDIIPLLKEKRKNEGIFVSKYPEHKSVDAKKCKEINADMLQTVWLDKSRYEDAEMKYHKNLATQQQIIETSNLSNKGKTVNKKKKKTREKIVPAKVGLHAIKKSETKLSLEAQVKNLESENSEFKIHLAQLNELVKGLEERVTNLEDRSQSCSLTDEGVDMTEESKCTFFNDCICNYEVAEEPVQILDNISLNDGSEFEEFIATTASDNSDTAKDNLWQEDWDDISGCDLATELRKNCRKTNS